MSEEILETTEVEESVDTVVEEVAVKTPAHYHDSENRVHSFDCQETADEVGIEGLTLINGDVYEWIADNPLIVELSEEETLQARKLAYADTLTGSDPLFINYQALLAKGSDSAEEAKEEWLTRREEIKQEYPKNVV